MGMKAALPQWPELITGVSKGPAPGTIGRVHVVHEDDDKAQQVQDEHAGDVDDSCSRSTGVDGFEFWNW